MKTFKITTNEINKHSVKPTNISVESVNTKTEREVTLVELASIICQPNGSTWCPAIFNGTRKNDNWIQQQAFALDFDNGTTPDEVIATLLSYGIIPNMVYGSFSDTVEHRKFRLVLVLDTIINNSDVAKWIIIQLMNLFGQKADKACKDLSRMFFGSKYAAPEYLSEQFVSTENLIFVLNSVAVASDSNKTRNCIDEIVSKGVNPIYIKDCHVSGQKDENVFNNGQIIEHFDFDKAAENVCIFADFLNGKWLTHPQLFGIATSLRWIKGGLKLMKETMNKWNKEGKTSYNLNNFGILPYVAKMNYTPTNLANYSSYEEDGQYANIIFAGKAVRSQVSIVKREVEISIEEAHDKMLEAFSRIIEKREKNKIFIIKVPTGLGKTELLSNLYNVSATIAFPTHKLKNEVAQRFKNNETDVKVTPELPEFSNVIKDKIQTLYNAGLYSDVNSLVKLIASNPKTSAKINSSFVKASNIVKTPIYSESDVELAKQYLMENNDCYSDTKNIVLTTHSKATFVNFQSDLMIFDECPLQQLLSIKNLNASELKAIIKAIPENEEILKSALSKFYTRIVDFSIETEFRNTEVIGILAEKRDVIRDVILNPSNGIETTNFLSFIDSCNYVKQDDNSIDFVCKREFQGIEDKTVIIMSATACSSIYERLGVAVEIIDLGKVKHSGKIVQDTSYSYSKSSMVNIIDKVVGKIGDLPVITFADMKSYFNNPVKEMHFGNCSGYDGLKGKDIAVVGTYHRPAFVYALMALALGEEIKTTDLTPSIKTVMYNNCNFALNTFKNDLMTRIQLDLINQELVQAVGRSRTLREICTVKLYSGFPLRETTEFTCKNKSK